MHRAAALAAPPLWQHALHSLAAITLAAGASALLSRALHKEADKVQAGEVRYSSMPLVSSRLRSTSL